MIPSLFSLPLWASPRITSHYNRLSTLGLRFGKESSQRPTKGALMVTCPPVSHILVSPARKLPAGLILLSHFPVDAGRLISHSSFLEWIGGALLLCDFCTDVTENTEKIGYIGFIQ
jgi:hypothetical protein